MLQRSIRVAHIPSWWHEALKRFIQYLAVPLAAVPAGIVYLLLLRILSQPLAFAVALPLGLVLAYYAWTFLDRRITFATKPSSAPLFVSATTVQFISSSEPTFGLAGCVMLVLVSLPPTPLEPKTYATQDRSIAATNVLTKKV